MNPCLSTTSSGHTHEKPTTYKSNSPMIQTELNWLIRPQVDHASFDPGPTPTLSRWSLSNARQELLYGGGDDNHLLSVHLSHVRGELYADGKLLHGGQILPGTMWIKEPRVSSRAIFRQTYTAFRLYLPQEMIAECYEAVYGRQSPTKVVLAKSQRIMDLQLKCLIRMLYGVDEEGDISGPMFVDGVSMAIVSRLIALDAKINRPESAEKSALPLAKWKLGRTIDYIEANLARPIHLAELSNLVGLSRMHFAAQFRAATGHSPHQYVLRRKIAASQELLKSRSMSLVDTALILGFKTQAHFAVVFKNIVGHTPARWRRDVCYSSYDCRAFSD